MTSKHLDFDIQQEAWAALACAVFIRAAADLRGRVDRSDGSVELIQQEAELFLTSSEPDWATSRKFWTRIGNIDQYFLESVIVPALMEEKISVEDLDAIFQKRHAAEI